MTLEIRPSRENEIEALSDLRVRSKGHWGYSRETLEAWRPAMAITHDYFRRATMQSILLDDRLVGFYALKPAEGLLDHLWLLPEAIGRGIGRTAFSHAVAVARGLGLRSLMIISDADAAGFYLKMGAQQVGEFYSPHQNRMLPKLLFTIPEEPNQPSAPMRSAAKLELAAQKAKEAARSKNKRRRPNQPRQSTR